MFSGVHVRVAGGPPKIRREEEQDRKRGGGRSKRRGGAGQEGGGEEEAGAGGAGREERRSRTGDRRRTGDRSRTGAESFVNRKSLLSPYSVPRARACRKAGTMRRNRHILRAKGELNHEKVWPFLAKRWLTNPQEHAGPVLLTLTFLVLRIFVFLP